MSRHYLWLSAAAVCFLAVSAVVVEKLGARPPAEAKAEPATPASAPPAAQLPIGKAVLYSSGVGYFQREGQVEGNARVDLLFPVQDINDLLKSMVVRDLDGGVVSTVSYDSNAPVERALKSFAVNLHGSPSFAEILQQAHGEKVEVVLAQANAAQPGTLTGSIMGVELQIHANQDHEMLNLWCADGVRSVKLADVQRVRFLNPTLDAECKKALDTLARSHDNQKKAVSINFLGDGKRNVRVGYVVENPVWKTSYRLVLGKDKDEKPYLQGWAIVENQSDEDWKDVKMALVSGRPFSFQMDLYEPLYVTRPTVAPDLNASPRPVVENGSLDNDPTPRTMAAKQRQLAMLHGMQFMSGGGFGGGAGGGGLQIGGLQVGGLQVGGLQLGLQVGGLQLGGAPGIQEPKPKPQPQAEAPGEGPDKLDLSQGVSAVASGEKTGDFFQYVIDKPVTLARQKSALLPILNKHVEGTRLSIYTERLNAKHPRLGLRFKNTSGLHLMQGPITVFDGNNYAGDARIPDVQPGEDRMISYAVDLGTEVHAVPGNASGKVTWVKAVKGIVHKRTVLRESKTYTIKNRSDQERLVMIQHPLRTEFTLVDAKPDHTTRDFNAFEVKVGPGKSESLTVTEERVLDERVMFDATSDDQVRVLINQPVASDKVKKGLEEAMTLRLDVVKVARERHEKERDLKTITDDQARLRLNLREMPPTAAAYKRYLEKFDQQETQIEALQAEIKKLQEQEFAARKKLNDFLFDFSAE